MMASRKAAAAPQRPRTPGARKGAANQYLYMAVGAAVVVILVVVLLTTGKSQPAPVHPKPEAGEEVGRKRTKQTSVDRAPKRSRREDRVAARRSRRSETDREVRRERTGRTRRSETGGFARGSSRRSSSSPRELKAIIVDGTGSRYALIGDKKLKTGDDVEGRRIVEVGADAVKVQYRDNTYSVRIGQTVY
jgi:hypothetical protein